MENTLNINENINNSSTPSPSNKIKIISGILIFAVVLIGLSSYFLYPKYVSYKEKIAEQEKQNQINQFYQKVLGSKEEIMQLTEEEYDLLLINPLTNPDLESDQKTTTSNITVGLKNFAGSPDIEVAFPFIPNLLNSDKKSVFLRLDSVKDSKGDEIFDPNNGFEDENDIFTDLDLKKKSSEDKVYLYGSRSLHLEDSVEAKYISEIKGRLIMLLPVGIEELSLGAADIGVEKPFANNFITLKEIKDDGIVVNFTGDFLDDVFRYKILDSQNNTIDSSGYTCSNNICEFSAENAVGVKLYSAKKIVTKEIPFVFNQVAEVESEEGQIIDSAEEVDKADIKDTTVNTKNSPKNTQVAIITSQEKEDIIKAYFYFKKILDTYDPNKMIEYSKKVYPNKIKEMESVYKTMPSKEEYKEMVGYTKIFFGYDVLSTPEKIRSLEESKWSRDSTVDISIEVEALTVPKFRKTNGVWYVHINDGF